MQELTVFNSPEFGDIRTTSINGEPYFVGKDVAAVLGYSNPRKALLDHVDAEDKTDGVTIRDSLGRDQNPTCINESGLYSLILSSKMPKAKAFKRWVTAEVLPSIRKHGIYGTQETIDKMIASPEWGIQLLQALKDEQTYAVDFPRLDGGLNLRELDYRLESNQSPEMKNLWWQDGVLQCRDGQTYLFPEEDRGTGHTCYEALFYGYAFFHMGGKLYYSNLETVTELRDGVPEVRGTFFRYLDWLFYKTRGAFLKIRYDPEGETPFTVSDVLDEAYVPTIFLNGDPATGSGDLYQPENRLSPRKEVHYNAKSGVTLYQLPVQEIDSVDKVMVDGEELQEGTDYAVDLAEGTVAFVTAPPVTEPATNNTVQIIFSKANADAQKAVLDCCYAMVAGGDSRLCILLAGSTAQPNAVFWNGNDDLSMNPAYWPMPFYNLAGDTEDPVTGFGKQYSTTLVLKERSVGKLAFSIEDIDGRDSISFGYEVINSKTGCDLPWSIQLIENNLVFCNTYQGVHLVRSSSSAYENNIECISKNVNGTEERPGLLHDVRQGGVTCSMDDDQRYWITANGHAYVWDYILSGYDKPSWFFFDTMGAVAYFRDDAQGRYHLDAAGRVTRFQRDFQDYGAAIDKVYQFPIQHFSRYDLLKDIQYILIATRSDTDSRMEIVYQCDYGDWSEPTPILAYSWKLVPRNLAYRFLGVLRYAAVAKRKPGLRHIRHFGMRLQNRAMGNDMSVVSAQIYYRYSAEER